MNSGNLKKNLYEAAEFIKDVIYPRRCPFCDGLLEFGGRKICRECSGKLIYVGDEYCRRCGRPLTDENAEYCRDCTRGIHLFDRGVSLYVYNDVTRSAIFRFKYSNRREYADFFAADIFRKLGNELMQFRADALIPVPLYKDKLKKRGFNQAELIAAGLSGLLGIKVRNDVIERTRATRPQKALSRAERQKNLKRSFKITGNVVKLNTVIIVDDIYTTGSTMDEMAHTLKSAGIERVFFVTLATGSAI